MTRKRLEGGIAVYPRNKWVIDVFTGEGWGNYSCFRIYKGTLKLVDGSPVTETEYKQLQGMVA
jgi:hypothetical protein